MDTRLFALALGASLGITACAEAPTMPLPISNDEVVQAPLNSINHIPDGLREFSRLVGGSRGNPCARGAHRQFDFWKGRFDLVNPDGSAAGWNRIRRRLGGCTITEDFIGTDGIRGRSLNSFDRATESWLQTYVDEFGTNFRLNGGLAGDQMVMSGERLFVLPSGGFFPVVDRITWTPLEARAVNQLIELSTDGGGTFPFALADLTYNRAHPFAPTTPVGSDACNTTDFSNLDRWLGRWRVRSNGYWVGTATVRKDLSNCLVEVRFRGRQGYATHSFLSYDLTTDTWHRTYLDNRGNAFRLESEASGSTLTTLIGTRPGPHGSTLQLTNTLDLVEGQIKEVWSVTDPAGEDAFRIVLTYSRH